MDRDAFRGYADRYEVSVRQQVFACCMAAFALCPGTLAQAQLQGHGGPVRSVAVAPDGKTAISGSFDSSAIRWSLERNSADQVFRFHDSAVNAVAALKDGRYATGGEDGRVAIWRAGDAAPALIFTGHTAPIVSIAASPDGATLASASWDRTIRIWPLSGGLPRILEGHTQNVNGVAFVPNGQTLVSAGYDATIRIWPLSGKGEPIVTTVPAPLNALVIADDGEIIAAGATGRLFFFSPNGELRAELDAADAPLISLAISPDGQLVAAAGIRGSVAVVDRKNRNVLRTLVGPGLPVWSVAFFPDSRTLLTGGTDRLVRRWNAESGEHIGSVPLNGSDDPLAAFAGDRGAEVYRACIACHTLSPDQGNRAGPTLAGIFGRKIATLPGYNFSESLKKLDIIWTPETVSKLFEIGPATYTPGTKMPEQIISSADDRKALVDFLARAANGK
jgi:cytochrome c